MGLQDLIGNVIGGLTGQNSHEEEDGQGQQPGAQAADSQAPGADAGGTEPAGSAAGAQGETFNGRPVLDASQDPDGDPADQQPARQ